jgi:hypothetical protein
MKRAAEEQGEIAEAKRQTDSIRAVISLLPEGIVRAHMTKSLDDLNQILNERGSSQTNASDQTSQLADYRAAQAARAQEQKSKSGGSSSSMSGFASASSSASKQASPMSGFEPASKSGFAPAASASTSASGKPFDH